MPPTIASARSLRIRVSLLLLARLRRRRLVEPVERGSEVVDDEPRSRLGNGPGDRAPPILGHDEDAAAFERDLDPGDVSAGADVCGGREQLCGDPRQLLSALRRA